MSHQLTTTRAARNRRLIAITAWAALIATAMILWNGRTQGLLPRIASEPAAFLLAAFTAFVSLFAWMLYNPARGVSAETPTLFLAGAATLFTPCIIGFCIMPPDSPLRGWLVVGLFLLLAIAIMSPVPDEFFAIPRERHTYMQPVPYLNISDRSVLTDNTNWFHTSDLLGVVDTDRPSLAPNAWRHREWSSPESERYSSAEPLDTEFDETIFDDDFTDVEGQTVVVPPTRTPSRDSQHTSGTRTSRAAAEQRAAEQRAAEQRASELRASEQRVARQRETQSRSKPERVREERGSAGIWFRPRPVAHSSDPASVPFGPPVPLSLLRTPSVSPPPIERPPAQPTEQSPIGLRTTESRTVESRLRSSASATSGTVRRAASGIKDKAAGIAGAAAGIAGAAAAAIPSAFRSKPVDSDTDYMSGASDVADVSSPAAFRSDVESARRHEPVERSYRDRDRFERTDIGDEGDRIQVADRPQEFERTVDEHGGELLEGTMTVHFDRGQKKANLHIPFSPPMPGEPEVECEAIGGESLRLKVPERRSYGIRIEARRADAEEEMDTEIGFAAVYVPPE